MYSKQCPISKIQGESDRIIYTTQQGIKPSTPPYAHFAFSVTFFFNPLVLRGRPLADLFDLRLVDEPTLRTFLTVAAVSSSRF
jgi:hypothetical protein